MTVVDPVRDARGWAFTEASGPDPVNGFRFLSEAYRATDPAFDRRVTVPVLWDKQSKRIVNNESSEVIRMLNSEFDEWGDAAQDFYPEELRGEIDRINDFVYANVNNGVYRTGFATTQSAYERAFELLFAALDDLEHRLARRRYLVGDRVTEADWRLFTTLVRFDPVYVGHFKCNLRRLVDYPNLWAYTRELYQWPGVAETVNLDHIKRHYYVTHGAINPTGVVPRGPEIDFSEPHGRG
jgi:putative glutathione S-transferase